MPDNKTPEPQPIAPHIGHDEIPKLGTGDVDAVVKPIGLPCPYPYGDSAWGRFAKSWLAHLDTADPHPVPYKTVLLITMVQKRASDKGCTLKVEGLTKCYPTAIDQLKYDTHTVLLNPRRVSSRRLVGKLLARVTDSFVAEQLKLGISEVQQIWLFEENQIAQV